MHELGLKERGDVVKKWPYGYPNYVYYECNDSPRINMNRLRCGNDWNC